MINIERMDRRVALKFIAASAAMAAVGVLEVPVALPVSLSA